MQFEGKVALITGALGTVGVSLVKRFADEGANVIALDRPGADTLPQHAGKLGPEVRYFGCNLADPKGAEEAVRKLADEVGGIDILINNACVAHLKPYEEQSYEEYVEQLHVNSTAPFVLTRAVAERMKAKRYGKIVNITSLTLNGNWSGLVPYVASKGALFGLVKSMARELGEHLINVNGISPGAILSQVEYDQRGDKQPEYERWVLEHQSLKRRLHAVDIANLAVFLSSSQADLITGQNIQCDGGW